MGHDRTPREFPGYTDSILTGDTKLKGSMREKEPGGTGVSQARVREGKSMRDLGFRPGFLLHFPRRWGRTR
jgi:hypothetical protein